MSAAGRAVRDRRPAPQPAWGLPNLADRRLGARVVAASDEFFGPATSLLAPHPPELHPDRYTSRGKWVDGWETRRRRGPGEDWCVIRLGVRVVVRGVNVDTGHFVGNHPESASVEACSLVEEPARGAWTDPGLRWTTLVPRSPLAPDGDNLFSVQAGPPCTHVRLTIHPDGGVARLRVHGEPAPDWERLAAAGEVDLAAALNGGRVVACSDEFFGAPWRLLLPGEGEGMWDGWETRRRRGPGHDWVIVRLGARGRIERAIVETHHFRGNFPESARLEVADLADAPAGAPPEGEAAWREVLPRTPLGPDRAHSFGPPDLAVAIATHARLSIHPDGGVSRLRLYGRVAT